METSKSPPSKAFAQGAMVFSDSWYFVMKNHECTEPATALSLWDEDFQLHRQSWPCITSRSCQPSFKRNEHCGIPQRLCHPKTLLSAPDVPPDSCVCQKQGLEMSPFCRIHRASVPGRTEAAPMIPGIQSCGTRTSYTRTLHPDPSTCSADVAL